MIGVVERGVCVAGAGELVEQEPGLAVGQEDLEADEEVRRVVELLEVRRSSGQRKGRQARRPK